MTCESAERWQRPNRGHITIKDEDTGQTVRSCGGCLEAGIDLAHLAQAAPTPAAPELGDPTPEPARA